ncbi:competence protein ComEA [Pseudomonas guariconensis]|uniref:Competence protein ComEA n=1 Tax=Pseudomonas putida TaxID=303 RepID=A0A6S5TVS8_PSEPU|nr:MULTISPECIES: ComEA family DNA-binding protein [Pseudomonas]BBT41346.1 competence protein ComEA [Pseudomonas putida]SDC54545.1 competence protein ComEA [Pseudomonas guariconensis]
MRNIVLSYLFLPLFAGLSFSLSAAPGPSPVPPVELAVTKMASIASKSQPAQIDVNTADATTLQQELSGIGRAKAEAIVAYREANGPFASVDELLEIKGIGNALLERNRDRLMVSE